MLVQLFGAGRRLPCNYPILRIHLLLPLLFFAHLGVAQKVYRGVVFDSLTMNALPGVHVAVKHSSRGTYTNAEGVFTIRCLPMDTLMMSSLGYVTLELPLIFEEDALFIRMREHVLVLPEFTLRANRLYPNKIIDRTHTAPRKMAGYQAFQSPFSYFSRSEREKRKIYQFVEESNNTQVYVQVITDPDVKKIFTEDYRLTEDEYYNLLAKFNETHRAVQYEKDPDVIMEALHAFISSTRN